MIKDCCQRNILVCARKVINHINARVWAKEAPN